jgi:ADP-ribose pyrophosphatase YjhB (NUDIX family)
MLLYMSNSARETQSTPLHSVSVAGAVVREDGRLLAIRRADNGTWELPGGVLELTEAPEDGVAREVWEETGIQVEVDELTGVYKNTTRGIVALVFRCKPSGGAEQPPSNRPRLTGSRPKRSPSGWPRSMRCACSMHWTGTGRMSGATMVSAWPSTHGRY